MSYTISGPGPATAATYELISGRAIAHSKMPAGQRAGIAAMLFVGEVSLQPTVGQAAALLGTSSRYVRRALKATPAERNAVALGQLSISRVGAKKPAQEAPAPDPWPAAFENILTAITEAADRPEELFDDGGPTDLIELVYRLTDAADVLHEAARAGVVPVAAEAADLFRNERIGNEAQPATKHH